VALNSQLDWADSAGATSYDVYFGTTTSPPFITNVPTSTYNPGTLTAGQTYYWRIVAKNACGDQTGVEWTFTACTLAATPVTPSPADAAPSVALNSQLDWADSAGATSYDVYFGTTTSPPFAAIRPVWSGPLPLVPQRLRQLRLHRPMVNRLRRCRVSRTGPIQPGRPPTMSISAPPPPRRLSAMSL
jgi:hypothetical protein